jgi:predicted nicotinamide N-methyase
MAVSAGSRRKSVVFPSGDAIDLFEAEDVEGLLEARAAAGDRAPYGAVLWSSAVILAAAILEGGPLQDRVVLELGAGTGLCSLAAAKRGARVVATDADDAALALLATAAAAQKLPVEVRRFDVFDDAPLPAADVVVMADVMYEPGLALGMARRAVQAIERGSQVLVADPGRAFRSIFESVLTERGHAARFARLAVRLGDGSLHEADLAAVERAR